MQSREWVDAAERSRGGRRVRFPLATLAGLGLYGLIGAAVVLLVGDFDQALGPPLGRLDRPARAGGDRLAEPRCNPERSSGLALALERGPGDAEILSRAVALAVPGQPSSWSCSTSWIPR